MKSLILLVCFTLLSACFSLIAQPQEYRFSQLNVNHGLSDNQIKTIFKDRRGFLWVGTPSGLNRYDGYSFRVFNNRPGDSTSLISNDVNKIFEGPHGKLWIHTWSGTNVYDPLTESFNRNVNGLLAEMKIPGGEINDISKDRHGRYWFLHATEGLYRYAPGTRTTVAITHKSDDSTRVASNSIASWCEDGQGNPWIIHSNGIIERLDSATLTVAYRDHTLARRFRYETLEYHMICDSDGELWFYISNRDAGVFRFNPPEGQWAVIDQETAPVRLNNSIVRGIVQDNAGLLWIATDHGGINLLDKKTMSMRYLLHHKEDDKSLCQNSINALYKDGDGIIWAGTFKSGLSYFHPNLNRFKHYRHHLSDPNSLPFNDINAIVEDEHRNLWFGTNGGGLIYFDRKRNSFKQYRHDPHNPNSLSTDVIVSLYLDRENVLWIGTYFGGLLSFDGKRFTHYRHDPEDPGSLSDNSVWEIFEDSEGNLWVGTLTRGVNKLDSKRQRFTRYNRESENPIHTNYITAFMEDRRGNLWIGTGYGIEVLDKELGTFTHYVNDGVNQTGLSNNSIHAFYEDSRGFIWVATHDGLNLFDPESETFTSFGPDDGLPYSSVLTVLEDNFGDLWVSTSRGISHLKVLHTTGRDDSLAVQFRNYDEKDGLQGIQFNANAACVTSAGELVFGGANGFNLFRPESIGINLQVPNVILTDLQIFNKTVGIGEEVNGAVVLQQSIGETDHLVLEYRHDVFSLEFASLSQFHPEKAQYQYKLEGFDKGWTTTPASQRRVTYTNLDPGKYVFKVRAGNNDGLWSEDAAALHITVNPPFWKSSAAFVLYAIATLGLLMVARYLILYNERIRFRIQQERERAFRMQELDRIKTRFFTNVSHEFRTPLALILAPVEKMIRTVDDPEKKKQFELIHRNARRLLSLVNQLLDFRKMEVQDIPLNCTEGDIVPFIREVFNSFSDLSDKKNIRFSFQTQIATRNTSFDADKLEKILFNLLSNAFKFTPENGAVTVSLDEVRQDDTDFLEIRVSDTGIGIPPEQLERVFDRFFQYDTPKSLLNQGSGIGLSITREFVTLHGGSISVRSDVGKGSCFTVRLPLGQVEAVQAQVAIAESQPPSNPESTLHRGPKPVLLIVEDNEDFRFYLKDNLKRSYQVLEARNGSEGWEAVVADLPDLVVSDIMMPEMTGVELCRKMRGDLRTSHIPVVLLTARTAEEQKVEGFACGANDYVTKPFNFEILQARIRNLIEQREALRRSFTKQLSIKPTPVEVTSLDEKLIQRAIKIVEENIGEPEFTVEKLSRELGMSRVHLYKKLMALTGKSPIEFIRNIRLQRAAQLLEESQLSVSEIAYQVGFNNPKYFSKYFKHMFKVLPSVYAQGNK